MELTEGRAGVASILRERAFAVYEFDEPGNAALAAFLAERAEIGVDVAEALVWGEATSPSAEEIASVARTLTLDPDLLSVLLVPSSADVVSHVMNNVVLGALNSEGCHVCYDLEAAILGGGELAEEGETELALMALSHLVVPLEEGDVSDDDSEAREMEALIAAVGDLDAAARRRVLAFALIEATNIDADETAVRLRSLSHLRKEVFTNLLNAVFDAIAVTDGGEMEEEALAHRLNLGDPGLLHRLPEQVAEAIAGMSGPTAVSGPPLLIEDRGDGRIYRLAPGVREIWISLLEVERSSLLISRPAT